MDFYAPSFSNSRRIKEKVDWVLPNHYGAIIGKKGATINEIRIKSGATVIIEKNSGGCFVEGTTSQIDIAKTLIKQKIKENESRQQISKTRITSPISDPNWNCVEFVQPSMIGKVMGKNGETIKSFEQNYGVKFRAENRKLYIYGSLLQHSNKMAIKGLHELLKGNVENEKALNDGGWEIVQHFDSKFIGMVFGKNGDNAKKLERQYGVRIKAMSKEKEVFLFIKGDDDQSKEKLRIYLRKISCNENYTGLKKVYFVGSCPIKFVDSKTSGLSKMSTSSLAFNPLIEKSFSSVPGLQEGLQEIFTNAKAKLQNLNGSVCDYIIHSGRMLCKKPCGEYLMSDLSVNDFVYRRLKQGDLEIIKINDLPTTKEYFRYDLSILTPKPIVRIRYKLFLQETAQGFSFISPKEAGVNEREFFLIETSPGYVSLRDSNLARVDIIDPNTSKTLRINTNIYYQDDEYESQLRTHLQVLNPIFKKIIFNNSNLGLSQMELNIPELPGGYLMSYLRRTIRKTYRFSGSNLLRTSEEKVLINLEVIYPDENEIVDLFFVNENINDLLEEDDWDPEEVVNEMENVIKFSDTMLQFLS